MFDRRRAGNAMTGVVVVLLIVACGAAWNYHRNLQIERTATNGPRPYEKYASSDLEALRTAYKSELAGVQAELAHKKSRRAGVAQNQGSISKNVEQFVQTTHASAAIREAAANVAERQAQIAELDTEFELRERFGQGTVRHLRLMTSFEGLISF